MAKITAKVAKDTLRNDYVATIAGMLAEAGEDVLQVKTNELSIPVVDALGEEHYVNIVVKIPSGSRDGDAYDGYAEAEDFAMKQKAKAEKKAEQEKKKAEKIARDKARREAKNEKKDS